MPQLSVRVGNVWRSSRIGGRSAATHWHQELWPTLHGAISRCWHYFQKEKHQQKLIAFINMMKLSILIALLSTIYRQSAPKTSTIIVVAMTCTFAIIEMKNITQRKLTGTENEWFKSGQLGVVNIIVQGLAVFWICPLFVLFIIWTQLWFLTWTGKFVAINCSKGWQSSELEWFMLWAFLHFCIICDGT